MLDYANVFSKIIVTNKHVSNDKIGKTILKDLEIYHANKSWVKKIYY